MVINNEDCKIENPHLLILAIAKRIRQITKRSSLSVNNNKYKKLISLVLEEIKEKKISFIMEK
ncbi:DNA-directed RNA polymerase subunit omega [bacterium]|nr:DNA-directed RNA polymerase subunit omega [bacterium]MBU1782567.1 DNA-directed RNA polymerase subunit omega [bacterium]MBU2599049.1 DNA-directed RNA polymerase subunit omega [bacterium]